MFNLILQKNGNDSRIKNQQQNFGPYLINLWDIWNPQRHWNGEFISQSSVLNLILEKIISID